MAVKSSRTPAETRTAVDASKPAAVSPATEFSPSGAPRQTVGIDPSHPAVDDNPRAGTSEDQNRVDYNDPIKPGAEVVAEQLGATPKDETSEGKGD